MCAPVCGTDQTVSRLIAALVRNITPLVIQQQKLDALHAAGRELAGLDADQLTDMNVEARVELLKSNLRRTIHDLLKYDTIEVRLLDRKTGELKPLLEDGMLPEAAHRALYASATGNGVTGFVAFTGKSYLCVDTANDPHYLAGAAGARSSMTVPLKFQDEVIGTLNVESPRVNGFGPDDLQFTELFSKEIAAALHTLDLLNAQQVCTAGQSIEAVNKEVALPLDEILAGASVLLARVVGTDPDATDRLRRMLSAARQVKDSIARVGRDLPEAAGQRREYSAAVREAHSGGRIGRAVPARGSLAPRPTGCNDRNRRHRYRGRRDGRRRSVRCDLSGSEAAGHGRLRVLLQVAGRLPARDRGADLGVRVRHGPLDREGPRRRHAPRPVQAVPPGSGRPRRTRRRQRADERAGVKRATLQRLLTAPEWTAQGQIALRNASPARTGTRLQPLDFLRRTEAPQTRALPTDLRHLLRT